PFRDCRAPYRCETPHTAAHAHDGGRALVRSRGPCRGARGDEVAEAGPGTYIYKPCGVPHTFWNPTDRPARLLEIICKAGFENYFVEIAELFATGPKPGGTEHEAIAARYNESHFMDWVPEPKARYGLKLLGES